MKEPDYSYLRGTVLPLRKEDDQGPLFLKFHGTTVVIKHYVTLETTQGTVLM